jgi:hypothetical protein
LLLFGVEDFPAGLGQSIMLFAQASDDAAAAGHGPRAIFIVIRLAGAALIRRGRLRKSCAAESAESDGEYEDRDV